MSARPDSRTNRPARVAWRSRHTVPWVVASVSFLGGYRFSVAFVDGTTGVVDMTPRLTAKTKFGVFERLRDPKEFSRVMVTDGYVSWPCGVDLAPDAMHDEILKHGRWVL